MEILRYPHKLLRTPCKPVKVLTKELQQQILQMQQLLAEHDNAVAIAANQVHIPYRIVVFKNGLIANGVECLINPYITRRSGSADAREGCLSFPDIFVTISRAKRVWIEGWTETGSQVKGKLTGLAARVIQHEIDHLDGKLFTRRAKYTERKEIAAALASMESVA